MTDIESCLKCGWCCEFPSSHIEYCGGGCEYIRSKYDVWFSDEGELEWSEKKKVIKKTGKNRLDRLPYDCLQHILSYCGDHLQYDFKKNVIYSNPFQSKLKTRFLLTEYEDVDYENDEDLFMEKEVYKHLFQFYPVSSFSIRERYGGDFYIDIKYRDVGDKKKYIRKKIKEDTEEYKEWNEEAKIFNKKIDEKQKNNERKINYTSVKDMRNIDFFTYNELRERLMDEIDEEDVIANLATNILWNNVYNNVKKKLLYDDIEELKADEKGNVLRAICDISGIADDLERDDLYNEVLGFKYCDCVYDELYLVERNE
jgi:hypothetical protein